MARRLSSSRSQPVSHDAGIHVVRGVDWISEPEVSSFEVGLLFAVSDFGKALDEWIAEF